MKSGLGGLVVVVVLLGPVLGLGACKGDNKAFCEIVTDCDTGQACTEHLCVDKVEPDAMPDATLACPEATHSCLAAPAVGWEGPVIGTRSEVGTALPDCTNDFMEAILVYEGLDAIGGCGCECPGNATGVQCGPAEVIEISACAGIPTAYDVLSIPSDSCVPLVTISQEPALQVNLGKVINTGACSVNSTNTLNASFEYQERYCIAPESAAACPSGASCMQNLDSSVATCIYQEGEHECPAEYPEQEMRHTSLSDDRACTTCECLGAANGPSCGGTVILGDLGIDCNFEETARQFYDANQCKTSILENYHYGTYLGAVTPTLACGGRESGGVLQGEASGVGLTTFCCDVPIPD